MNLLGLRAHSAKACRECKNRPEASTSPPTKSKMAAIARGHFETLTFNPRLFLDL
jgi:hypothetical protein